MGSEFKALFAPEPSRKPDSTGERFWLFCCAALIFIYLLIGRFLGDDLQEFLVFTPEYAALDIYQCCYLGFTLTLNRLLAAFTLVYMGRNGDE